MNLFGTDGIRGRFGKELTPSVAYALGRALAEEQTGTVVVIGMDTRTSGGLLSTALSRGVFDHGGQVLSLGVVPTNAVAHYVLKTGADFGVMISASHNPPDYNGLKVFDKYGVKICLSKQEEFSNKILQTEVFLPNGEEILSVFDGSEEQYVDYVCEKIPVDCDNLPIAIDCCYGSAYKLGKEIFLKSNAKVIAYCDFAKGQLINVDCGATSPEFLAEQMKNNGCKLGFAFDGDADRLAVFEETQYLSPDRVLYAYAKYFYEKGQLAKNTVVGTVMTDGGLEESLKKIGITLVRTDVGDSNVFEEMTTNGYVLGGENSGHYLLSNYATGSDAIINALLLTAVYLEKGSIIDYTAEYVAFCRKEKSLLMQKSHLQYLKSTNSLQVIKEKFCRDHPSQKLVLRFSGTEPKIRIMVEGKTTAEVEQSIVEIIDSLNKVIDERKKML